ncbi:MAG: hypothetical protein ABI397_02615 [Candidatus Saccharimonas sp.]
MHIRGPSSNSHEKRPTNEPLQYEGVQLPSEIADPYRTAVEYAREVYASNDPVLIAQIERAHDAAVTRNKKAFSRRSFLGLVGKAALVAGVAATTVEAPIKADQWVGDHLLWPSTGVETHEVAMNRSEKYPSNSGTFVFEGFAEKNATAIAEALFGSLQADGHVYAIEYDNHGIDVNDIVESILVKIDKDQLKEMSFYGRSMGGDVALLVASELLKRRPALSIKSIILDCTPSSIDAVRGWDKGLIESGEKISKKLDLVGGPTLRMAIELPHSPQAAEFIKLKPAAPYVDVSAMVKRFNNLYKWKINSKSTSNRILFSQLGIIMSMDIHATFAELSKLTEHQAVPPSIIEIRPKNSNQDEMVLNDVSEEEFRSASNKLRMHFYVVNLVGKEIRHADPRASRTKYNTVLSEIQKLQTRSDTTKSS